jgi:hypothetical protein
MNKKFQSNLLSINLADYFENKVPLKNYFDLVLSMHTQTAGKPTETVLATYCNISGDKTMLGKPCVNFELKTVYQELNV